MQNALKLDHCDGRVCVVELDGHLLREVFPVVVRPAKATDDVLERTGNEKILLEQTKLFSALGLVIRVKNFRNGFTVVLFANGFLVTAAVEGLKVEFLRRSRFPEAQEVNGVGSVAGDWNVIGNAEQFFSSPSSARRSCPCRRRCSRRNHKLEFPWSARAGRFPKAFRIASMRPAVRPDSH